MLEEKVPELDEVEVGRFFETASHGRFVKGTASQLTVNALEQIIVILGVIGKVLLRMYLKM